MTAPKKHLPKKHWSQTIHANRYALVPAAGPRITTARRLLLDTLAEGDIVDPDGYATRQLHERMAAQGYQGRHTTISHLLHDAEIDELIQREIRGRRTYAIRLTGAPTVSADNADELDADDGDDVVVDITDAPDASDDVDLDALAAAVLDQALAARQAAYQATQRAEEAEEALRRRSANDNTEEALRAALERRTAELAHAQSIAAAVKRTSDRITIERDEARDRAEQAETAVAVFRERCEELDAEVKKLGLALRANEVELHQIARNGHAYPLREHLSMDSRRELARLMAEVPSRRGA